MLSQTINEISWHFLGYMKMWETLASAEQIFDSASFAKTTVTITPVRHVPGQTPKTDLPYEKFSALPPLAQEQIIEQITQNTRSVQDQLNTVEALTEQPPQEFETNYSVLTDTSENSDVPLDYTYTIHLSYQDIYAPNMEMRFEQLNALNDDDLLISRTEFSGDVPVSFESSSIDTMLEAADQFTPDHLDTIFEGNAQTQADAIADALIQRAEEEASNPSFTSGDNIGTLPEPKKAEDEKDEDANTGEPEQSYVATGDNEAVNAAAIVDLSELTSSTVVMGDYYASNSIIQANLFVGALDGPTTSGETGETIETVIFNQAEIAQEGDYLISSNVTYNNPDYSFQVDVVHGNFYDLNIVSQQNHISDNDRISYQLNSHGYYVSTGDNTQVNASQLIDNIQNYDLIVVLGNYYDVNYIQQTNILLDADEVLSDGVGIDELASHNLMTNEAKIKNVGGADLMKPMNGAVRGLVDGMDDQQVSYEYTAPTASDGLPILQSTDLKVLYVTGDYYQMNAIEQLNVMSDADFVKLHEAEQSTGTVVQTVNGEPVQSTTPGTLDTSNNTTKNDATIIDYDSQSGFQYLEGEYTEEDIVIKVNVVVSEEDELPAALNKTDGLVPEVVAFTGEDERDQSGEEPLFAPHAANSDMILDLFA